MDFRSFLFLTQCVRVGRAKVLIPTLQAIPDGSRDAALADNPDLDYDDAAEVALLLETLPRGAWPKLNSCGACTVLVVAPGLFLG